MEMEPDFWLKKWQDQETGFHLGKPHPLLSKFFDSVIGKASTIFVPLCGKSNDLEFIQQKNKLVIANELSEIAINAYFQEKAQHPQIQVDSKFKIFQHESLSIYCGDYFQLKSDWIKPCQGIYDRAALIALPKDMRKAYVEKMRSLCPSAKLLLITLEYPQSEMNGPPFSVSSDEIECLFDFADIEQLYRQDILDKEPKFKQRGLTGFVESAYQITW